MKKLFLVLVVALTAGSLLAENSNADYVATNNDVVFFKKVKSGVSNYLVGVKSNGEKYKFHSDEITSYTKNGRHFEKMPLFNEKGETKSEVFMELLKAENGMRVFKHTTYDVSGNEISDFYVYKNRDYVVQIDEKNYTHLVAFF